MDDEKKLAEEMKGLTEDTNEPTGDEFGFTEEEKNSLLARIPKFEESRSRYDVDDIDAALRKLDEGRYHGPEDIEAAIADLNEEERVLFFQENTSDTPSEHAIEAAIADLNSEELGLWLIRVLGYSDLKNAIIPKLLQKNANVNATLSDLFYKHTLPIHDEADVDDFNINALYVAAEYGDLETVKVLLHAGAVVNPMQCGRAINIAALKGHEAVVRELLQAGAEIQGQQNQYGVYSYSTLHFAAFGGNLAIVKLLVEECKADIHAPSAAGNTPLMAASMAGSVEVIEYLLKQGAHIDHQNQQGVTALHSAVAHSVNFDVFTNFQLLIAGGVGNDFVKTCASKRIQKFQTIQCLLQNKADVNLPDVWGYTAIFSALNSEAKTREKPLSAMHTPNVFQLLLNSGADIHWINSEGENLLFPAIRNKQTDIVQWLLAHGADINLVNKEKQTVFDCLEGIPECAEIREVIAILRGKISEDEIEAITIKKTVGNLLVKKQMEPLLWAFAYGDTLENLSENATASADVDTASVEEEKVQNLPSPPPLVQFAQSDIVDVELVREVSKLLKHPPKP